MKEYVGRNDIEQAIREAGLAGAAVSFHSSMKSFGLVDGGADSIVDAFLNCNVTMLVPSHSYNCEVPYPDHHHYKQNGLRYTPDEVWDTCEEFSTDSSWISDCMGAVPKAVMNRAAHIRGNHPIDSLTSIGPLAKEIIAKQAPLDVYASFAKMYSMDKAFVVLAGVGLTSATAVHFAETLAGRYLFRRWARLIGGKTIEVEIGGCSSGFENLAPIVVDLEVRIVVGKSLWRIYPMKQFVNRISSSIKQNPALTKCDKADCVQCEDMSAGGAVIY